ncbi:MAG: hypothetical protein N4Q32_03675, partial [Neisseriaceae bacterium]|nr:hypothetical protein [Neisseriaceae bacterium]
ILLKKTGFVIYLKAKPDFLFKRMEKDTSRPLLQGVDPLQKLTNLYEERVSFYNEVSDIVYPINDETPAFHRCVEELSEIIKQKSGDDDVR